MLTYADVFYVQYENLGLGTYFWRLEDYLGAGEPPEVPSLLLSVLTLLLSMTLRGGGRERGGGVWW